MSPTSRARLRDARALAALGLAAGIAVPAALLAGPQAAARPVAPAPAAPVSLTAGAAAGAGAGAVAADAADAGEEQPVCGDPDAKEFPIEARIQDAPRTYVSGGGYGTWFLDLTNTTGTACGALHPVLVLSDGERRLTADQIQLKFSEPGRTDTEHRATWETTDRHEQIGVFGGSGPGSGSNSGSDSDDFLGFTVPAGGTISVRVRMAFGSETGPARVTAHAAVVQRRHQDKAKGGGREDGDWVGESGAYRFVVVDGATGEYPRPEATGTEEDGGRTDVPAAPRPRTDTSSGAPTPAPTYTGPGKESAPESGTRPPTRPDGSVSPRSDADADAAADADAGSDADEDRGGRLEGDGSGGKERPARPPHYDTGRPLPELARTGPELLPWAGALAGILILCGGVLVAQGRRMRRAAD
ncbi:peptidase [Streptomyces bacillaris]|uniref:peptidase n=1 Tax=Streptomyces bacillaris TaxID=68179 RepID=UPI0037F87593